MANVMCSHLRMQEEDNLEYTNVKCRFCTLCTMQSTCDSFCNIDIHLITLLNIFNTTCHEVTVVDR
jgi:hypothetical protein